MEASETKKNGYFITFEGIDGSGKSLQMKNLAGSLSEMGFQVLCLRDPGGPDISEQIRAILLSGRNRRMGAFTELLLYEAARAQLVSECIRPALEAGKIVLCDRFTDSTVAYQGYGRNLDPEMIREANKVGSLHVTPDRTYLLDIDFQESIRRRSREGKTADRMENNSRAFFERIRNGYLNLARENSARILQLDGVSGVQTLSQRILRDALSGIRRKAEKG